MKKLVMKKYIVSTITALLLGTSSLFAIDAQNSTINPFEEIRKLQQQMDQIFNRFHQKFLNDAAFAKFDSSFAASPAIDMQDNGKNYTIKANIPGVDEKSINITQKDGMLTIKAKSMKEKEEKNDKFMKKERFVGEFVRVLTLPKDADADNLKTEYKNGVLKIVIPKK